MKTVVLVLFFTTQFFSYVCAQTLDTVPPTWAVDPDKPGPSQPELGRSLFDTLFARDDGHQVPFPFEALVANIQDHLETETQPARVLIPLGRSLQREAAAPRYFEFPRVVVAIDTEPRQQPGYAEVYLKNLLFLGYQEKANTIEVISYNDEAARFEFQTVLNYATGVTPYVTYPQRTLCTSCHQNGGPIFPEVPWSETDVSLSVSRLVEASRPDYYDKPVYMRDTGRWITQQTGPTTSLAISCCGNKAAGKKPC